jgi:hypothetical protein
MKRFVLLLITLVFFITGCASTSNIIPSSVELTRSASFEPPPGKSGLYLYLAKSTGIKTAQIISTISTLGAVWLAKFPVNVVVDDVQIGEVNITNYYYLELSPGKHTIVFIKPSSTFSSESKSDPIEINMKPNRDYFVESVGEAFGENAKLESEEKAKDWLATVELLAIPPTVKKHFGMFKEQSEPSQEAAPVQQSSRQSTKPLVSNQDKSKFERLVLIPLRVNDEDKSLQGAMETALVEGLQQKYIVFAGPRVSQIAHEVFANENKQQTHGECDETRCLQNIAGAFQAEILAVGNVTKKDGNYFLSLSIQNIFDDKVIYSKSTPCKNCDATEVVEALKQLSDSIE